MKAAADTIDNAHRIVRPLWAIIVGIAVVGFWLGKFYYEWQDAYNNGSPVIREFIQQQRVANEKQQEFNESVKKYMEREK